MRRKWHGLNILRRRAIRASLRKRGKHELVGDRSVTLIVSGITGVERDPHEAISRKFKAALGGIPRLHDCTLAARRANKRANSMRRGSGPSPRLEQQFWFRELAEFSALWSSDFLHGSAICCRL